METDARAKAFIRRLGEARGKLTKQQITTLKGQALRGDAEGAEKGLEAILRRAQGNRNGGGAEHG